MGKNRYLYDLHSARLAQQSGYKAFYLNWLRKRGFSIPHTLVVPISVHGEFRSDPERFRRDFTAELSARLPAGKRYAVRSSANLEDSRGHSFAGQFVSVLDLSSPEEIAQAAESVFASSESAALQGYLQQAGIPSEALAMGLVIQEMVPARAGGVAFSKNPLTGMDEVVVEAVPGSSQALLHDGQTPLRWVYKWGAFLEEPSTSPLDSDLTWRVVHETQRIARAFGAPVDLEWIYDGHELYWVQLRPITGLEAISVYSNRIPREFLPGLIKPLVWSVNIPVVNSAWIRLFSEMIGPNDLTPQKLAKAFYYRAYFNMGAIGQIFTSLGLPKESIERVMGLQGGQQAPRFRPSARTLTRLPRLLAILAGKLGYERQARAHLAQAQARYRHIWERLRQPQSESGLLAQVDELLDLTGQTAYANIVAPLLMGVYNTLLRRQLARMGIDYARFDLTGGMDELKDFDVPQHLLALGQHFALLDPQTQARWRDWARTSRESRSARSAPDANMFPDVTVFLPTGVPAEAEFIQGLQTFLESFGHLSESGNDFSHAPWRETPGLVLEMALAATQSGSHAAKTAWEDLPLNPLRRALLAPLYRRARRFVLLREQVSSLYTFGYGLFRDAFLALGEHYARDGRLAQPQDIFYLYLDEARALSSASNPDAGTQALVARRVHEMEASRDLALPDIIYGEQPPPLENPQQRGEILTGIPSSAGYYSGPVKVIRNLAEAGKLQPGDVLVIPYSEASWTPLFTRAGAVIAESGGMLSHSSIVAREYGIPCVVSAAGACQLADNTLVAIDGHKGEIRVIGEA